MNVRPTCRSTLLPFRPTCLLPSVHHHHFTSRTEFRPHETSRFQTRSAPIPIFPFAPSHILSTQKSNLMVTVTSRLVLFPRSIHHRRTSLLHFHRRSSPMSSVQRRSLSRGGVAAFLFALALCLSPPTPPSGSAVQKTPHLMLLRQMEAC